MVMTQAVLGHGVQLRRRSCATFSPPLIFLIMGHVASVVLEYLASVREYRCPSDRVAIAYPLPYLSWRVLCLTQPERNPNAAPLAGPLSTCLALFLRHDLYRHDNNPVVHRVKWPDCGLRAIYERKSSATCRHERRAFWPPAPLTEALLERKRIRIPCIQVEA